MHPLRDSPVSAPNNHGLQSSLALFVQLEDSRGLEMIQRDWPIAPGCPCSSRAPARTAPVWPDPQPDGDLGGRDAREQHGGSRPR
jgi:hypothetical protein